MTNRARSLSGWGSYDPLRISKAELQQLVIDESVDASFASAVGAFGELPRHSEQGLGCCTSAIDADGSYSRCCPYPQTIRPDFSIAISYLLRFAEQDSQSNWKVRQIGIYHRFLKSDDSHLWLILQSHPKEEDAFSKRLEQAFDSPAGRAMFNANPFCLHELLLDNYLNDWRWYMNVLGREYGKQVSSGLSPRQFIC